MTTQLQKLNKAISVLALHREGFISRRMSNPKGDKHCAVGWLLAEAKVPVDSSGYPTEEQSKMLWEIYGLSAYELMGTNDEVVGFRGKEASRIRAKRVIQHLMSLKRGLEADQPLLDATVGHTHAYGLSGGK